MECPGRAGATVLGHGNGVLDDADRARSCRIEFLMGDGQIASLAAAGISSGISWRFSSGVAHAFYVGNMVWMTITAGMLYQETTQQLCNAYLWDDQAITGQALVVASIILAVTWILMLAGQTMRRLPQRN
jgi:hypothetical protein